MVVIGLSAVRRHTEFDFGEVVNEETEIEEDEAKAMMSREWMV